MDLCTVLMPLILILHTICFEVTSSLDVRLPPAIIKGPKVHHIFRDSAKVDMTCVATASVHIEYRWTRNDVSLDMNAENIKLAGDGTGSFVIEPATSLDEGSYLCRAETEYGTAMSNTSVLQRAVLRADVRTEVINLTRTAGQPFHIPIVPLKCFPPPSFSWITARIIDNEDASDSRTVITNKRIQISETGELFFAYATSDDASRGDKVYKSVVTNPYLDQSQGTSYTRVIIRDGPLNDFRPTKAFTSATTTVALEGRNISIQCFFYGKPAPTISFRKRSGSLPIGRHSRTGTELLIKNVQPSDEGDYVCEASNTVGEAEEIIQIDVQAVPVFKQISDGPHNMNVTEGDSAVINCTAYAEPAARVQWFRNGEPLNPKRLAPRFLLTNDNRQLKILDVCKTCSDGTTDLQVIQCNASNQHGYAFRNAYINVLLRTVLRNSSTIRVTVDLHEDAQFEFPCSAQSDDLTPVTTQWYRVDDETKQEVAVRNVPGKLTVNSNGSLSVRLVKNDSALEHNEVEAVSQGDKGDIEGWAEFHGQYTCRASNFYSEAVRVAFIHVRNYIPPAAQKKTGLAGVWWILVVVAVILLMVILLLFCCMYCLLYTGETYKVDKKERKTGNNPEKELHDNGFHDYQRPSDVKGSRATLESTGKANSDDGGSMNEYAGDVDFGKFNEEGSFVGEYAANISQ